jgi:hypothetical protein
MASRVWSWLLPSLVLGSACSLCFGQSGVVQALEERTEGEAEDSVELAWEGDSIVYSADYVEYLVEEEKVLLIGNARAKYGNVRVEAETLLFDAGTKEIEARGYPVLYDGEQEIYGDAMRYEIETGYGEIMNGRTRVEKGWFEGKYTRKVGRKTLEIEEGTFTTCDRTPPHYFFAARRMKVYEDDMVISEPVLMYVGDVPVFFMPYWFFPIKKGRQSGFLLPKVGTDRNEGKYVKELAYFQVLNDYSDLLISGDFMENRGLRTTAEGVYIVKPYLEGKVVSSYIDEMYTGRKRWRLEANHRQNMGWRTRLRARGDFQSDVDYEVDYNENRIVQLNRRLESYLSLTKTWSGASADFVVNRTENLDTEEVSQVLPRASLSINDRRILEPASETEASWYNKLRASLSALLVNSKEDSGDEAEEKSAGDAKLNLSMPVALLKYINLSPSLRLRETVFDSDTTGDALRHRFHYSSALSANTTIYGLSAFGFGPIKVFRHVFRPSVSYNYSPEPEETYYTVSGIEGASGANRIGISLGNDLQAKLGETGSSSVVTLASIGVNASYDFKKEEDRLSDIASYLRLNPVSRLDLDVRMSHDPEEEFKLTGLSSTARLRLGSGTSSGKGWGSTLAGNYVRNVADRSRDTYQVWGEVDFWPTEKWYLAYSQRYDLKEREQIEQSVTVVRDLHGWEARFEWETFGEEWRYDVRLSIKAIPEIKLGKGIFGVFLP